MLCCGHLLKLWPPYNFWTFILHFVIFIIEIFTFQCQRQENLHSEPSLRLAKARHVNQVASGKWATGRGRSCSKNALSERMAGHDRAFRRSDRSKSLNSSNIPGRHSWLSVLCSVSSRSVVMCVHNANETSLWVLWYWHWIFFLTVESLSLIHWLRNSLRILWVSH